MKQTLTLFLVAITGIFTACGGDHTIVHRHPTVIGPLVLTAPQASNMVFAFQQATSGAISPGSPTSKAILGGEIAGFALVPISNFLYVVDESGVLAPFTLDPSTGAINPIPNATLHIGAGPISIVAINSGLSLTAPGFGFVFVYSQSASAISVFQINVDGRLTAVPGSPFGVPRNPVGLGPQAAVNQLLTIGTVPAGPSGVKAFLYLGNGALGTISAFSVASNGVLTEVPGSPFSAGNVISAVSGGIPGIVGFVFAADQANNRVAVFAIDPATGSLLTTPGSPFQTGLAPVSLAFGLTTNSQGQTSGRFLYVANQGSNNLSGFKIDNSSGVLTPLAGSPFALDSGPFFVRVDRFSQFVEVGEPNQIEVLSLDKSSGALTSVPGSPFKVGTAPNALDTAFFPIPVD